MIKANVYSVHFAWFKAMRCVSVTYMYTTAECLTFQNYSFIASAQSKQCQIQAQKFRLANFSNWQQMGLLLMFEKFTHNNIIKYSDKYKASKDNIPLYYSKDTEKKRDSFILQSDLNYEKIQIMRCHTVFI